MDAVIYARISERKMERDVHGKRVPTSDSIEDQIAACTQLAQTKGLALHGEPFIDRLVTGTKPRRNFQLALDTAKQIGGCVLCYDLSRCYRSVEHMLGTIAYCERHDIPIITVMGDGFDPSGGLKAADRFMAQVLAAAHELMARQKSERVAAAMQRKRNVRGAFGGGVPPFGFKLGVKVDKDTSLVPVRKEVQAVCYLLYCRRRKISFHLACADLNAAGYTRRGKPWNNKRANGIVRWWKARLQEDGVMGDLCRRALRRSRFVECPWACCLDEPPKQYQRRLKRQ